jgi:hypothetical protein
MASSAEEKRKAAALRKKEKAEKEKAAKELAERGRGEKARADEGKRKETILQEDNTGRTPRGRRSKSPSSVDNKTAEVTPGVVDATTATQEEILDEEEQSPEKKKSRPNLSTPIRPTLKEGRYSTRPSTPGPQRMHLHEHKRAIIEAGLALDSPQKFDQLISALSSLISLCQIVDEHFVINPIIDDGRKRDWADAKQILPP